MLVNIEEIAEKYRWKNCDNAKLHNEQLDLAIQEAYTLGIKTQEEAWAEHNRKPEEILTSISLREKLRSERYQNTQGK